MRQNGVFGESLDVYAWIAQLIERWPMARKVAGLKLGTANSAYGNHGDVQKVMGTDSRCGAPPQ